MVTIVCLSFFTLEAGRGGSESASNNQTIRLLQHSICGSCVTFATMSFDACCHEFGFERHVYEFVYAVLARRIPLAGCPLVLLQEGRLLYTACQFALCLH